MRSPAPNDAVQAPTATSAGVKIVVIAAATAAVVGTIYVVAIALGVGLGVGLRIGRNDDSTSSSSQSPNSSYSSNSSVTDCTYKSSTCGCAAIKPTFLSTKIVNGYSATPHSWPWLVALYVDNAYNCGGFLADSYQFVITAAHCLVNADMNTVTIYAGVDTLSSRANAQVRNVSNWKIHPYYYTSFAETFNDIAVIKLTSSFDKNDNVGLCCLPSGNIQLPIIGESAVIVGWGTTVSGDISSLSDSVLQGVIDIKDTSQTCDVTATSAVEFCAGRGTTDTCQGDSGGPLMTSVNNSWTCTGIVSHGNGCGNTGYYARVSAFIPFINNAIQTL